MGSGVLVAIEVLFGLLDRAAAIKELIEKVQAEGRDITEDELKTLAIEDDIARNELAEAIARRKLAP